jgi:cobalt-zinc-cadmium efflux system outer membrane protein
MHHTQAFLPIALCATAFSISLPAQVLTLGQAIDLANSNHPSLQAGEAAIEGARATIVTAKAYPNPEAAAMAGGQTYRVPGNVRGFVTSYSFTQPLETGALRPTRIAVAERGRENSLTSLEAIRLAVLTGVRRAFYQVLRTRGEIGILAENLRLVEDLRQRIQVRVDVGEAGRLELIRADAEVATARTAANSARLREISALSQLRAAIGSPVAPALDITGDLDVPPVLPPIEEVRLETLGKHPLLTLAQGEVRRADARIAYEKALRKPQPSLRTDIDVPPDTPTYRVGINIPIPIWNRREGPIAEAVAQSRQAAAVAQRTRQELLAAVEGAYGRYQLAGQQLAAFETGLIREAEEALRAAETAYLLGERGILEVLDSQRVLRSVRLDFLNAQYDRQAALIDLEELRAVDLRGRTP